MHKCYLQTTKRISSITHAGILSQFSLQMLLTKVGFPPHSHLVALRFLSCWTSGCSLTVTLVPCAQRWVEMSDKEARKATESGEAKRLRTPGLRGLPSTALFRAVNPELFIKPVRAGSCCPGAQRLIHADL